MSLLVGSGCDRMASSGMVSAAAQQASRSDASEASQPDEPVNAIEAKRFDGRTLNEWRELIQQIDYRSPERANVVTGLRAVMNDPEVPWYSRRQAALTLGRIGKPAVSAIPELLALLDVPVDPVETSPPLWALKALSLYGALAIEAGPRAEALLRDPKQSILLRLTASEVLGRIGELDSRGVLALIDGGAGRLEGPDEFEMLELRIACLEGLQFGTPAMAMPMLINACEDESERVRHSAIMTVGAYGIRAEPAAQLLAGLVAFDLDVVVRESAVKTLVRLGASGSQMMEELLNRGDDGTRMLVLEVLVNNRVEGAGLRREILALTEDRYLPVQSLAVAAWWEQTRQAGPVLARLVSLLECDERQSRKLASDTLLKIGKAAMPIRDQLVRIKESGDVRASQAAERVLRQLEVNETGRPE